MDKFYFTFGTDSNFPFYRCWIEVHANNIDEAIERFRNRFPDRKGHEGTVNCAFWYNEERFIKTPMYLGKYPEERCHMVIE